MLPGSWYNVDVSQKYPIGLSRHMLADFVSLWPLVAPDSCASWCIWTPPSVPMAEKQNVDTYAGQKLAVGLGLGKWDRWRWRYECGSEEMQETWKRRSFLTRKSWLYESFETFAQEDDTMPSCMSKCWLSQAPCALLYQWWWADPLD